ncbi:DUF4145 domain-containing protein [uncultured Deefgea sp.]|uniref:DUF4145 domain-containing protein n=1 Tax=uncultured Deefgea sp. TaxID=1304914 RepID=UPI0025982D14|nr:DUF4145 domain-containing protein [uncultured Deefgea sp.]
MDRDKFKPEFDFVYQKRVWQCPSCISGYLIPKEIDLKLIENAETINYRDCEAFEYDWISYVFHGQIKCNYCPETVVVSGIAKIERDQAPGWPEIDEMIEYKELSPKFFFPAVPIIDFSRFESVPANFVSEIKNSFSLYWCNPAACINSIRSAIEVLLDYYSVKKNRSNGSLIFLGDRLKDFEKSDPEKAKILNAIKWLGNSGSHKPNSFRYSDALDGYEILEHFLETFFPMPKCDHFIKTKIEAINSARGPVRD